MSQTPLIPSVSGFVLQVKVSDSEVLLSGAKYLQSPTLIHRLKGCTNVTAEERFAMKCPAGLSEKFLRILHCIMGGQTSVHS